MKTALILFFAISAAHGSLSLEDPLSRWLYHSEAFGPLLPGELPSTHTIHFQPGSRTAWIWQLMQDRGAVPGTDGSLIGWKYSASGELLHTESEFISRAGGKLEFFARPVSWLSIHERTSIWSGSDTNPPSGFSPFHYGLEHGRHFYVDWGYARAETGPLEVFLGRVPLRWGPGRFTQLLISGNAPSMDMLKVNLDLGRRVTFSGFTTTIDSAADKWLSGHRLDIMPLDNLRLGFSETILYAEGFDLAYANPFIPWYPVQWNEREDDNAFMCIDATWQPVRGLALYGEFLIDDIQYNNVNDVPNKLGITAGADWFHPGQGLGATFEYTAIQQYVYSQRKEANYYLHDDRIIGSALGPDADRLTAAVSWCGLPGLTTALQGSYTRHGETDVYSGWPDSVSSGAPFPSGIVENTAMLSLDLGWYHHDWLEIRLGGYLTTTDNTGHVDGAESSDSGITLGITAGQGHP